MRNAMIIDGKDNVAVAIEPIAKGDTVTYAADGQDVSLTAAQDIIIYHKSEGNIWNFMVIAARMGVWASAIRC